MTSMNKGYVTSGFQIEHIHSHVLHMQLHNPPRIGPKGKRNAHVRYSRGTISTGKRFFFCEVRCQLMTEKLGVVGI